MSSITYGFIILIQSCYLKIIYWSKGKQEKAFMAQASTDAWLYFFANKSICCTSDIINHQQCCIYHPLCGLKVVSAICPKWKVIKKEAPNNMKVAVLEKILPNSSVFLIESSMNYGIWSKRKYINTIHYSRHMGADPTTYHDIASIVAILIIKARIKYSSLKPLHLSQLV